MMDFPKLVIQVLGIMMFVGYYIFLFRHKAVRTRSFGSEEPTKMVSPPLGVPVYRNDYEARCRILQEENERLHMERALREADVRSLRGDRISERMTLFLLGASAAVFAQLILAAVISPEIFVQEDDATAPSIAASQNVTWHGDACVITDASRETMAAIRPSWLSPPTFPLPAGTSALMNDADVTFVNADRWDLITKWRLAEGLARAGARTAPELLWRP